MNTKDLLPIEQFCKIYEIEFSFISSLNDFGLIELIYIDKDEFIELEKIQEVERIIRLHNELGVNLEGIDIITNLIEKIDNLQKRLHSVQNQLDIYKD
jgi:hypothetical protein